MAKPSLKSYLQMNIKNVVWLKRMAMRGGHPVAERRLLEMANRLGKSANRRLDTLERHGKTLYAYDLAQSFLQVAYEDTRYRTDITDPEEAYNQFLSVRQFMNKSTSTLKGYTAVEDKRIQAFRDTMDLPKSMTKKDVSNLLKFLGEKPIRKLIAEHFKGSGDVIDAFREKTADNPTAKDEILELVKAYQRTEQFGDLLPTGERLYYDELAKYLKGQINLTIKEGKIIRGKNKGK